MNICLTAAKIKRWDVYLVMKENQGWKPNATVFGDIGGNIGYQCAELKNKYPKSNRHGVLQDLPGPIRVALSTPGVENMAYGMFKPQAFSTAPTPSPPMTPTVYHQAPVMSA